METNLFATTKFKVADPPVKIKIRKLVISDIGDDVTDILSQALIAGIGIKSVFSEGEFVTTRLDPSICYREIHEYYFKDGIS